jgi:hypothetical protein
MSGLFVGLVPVCASQASKKAPPLVYFATFGEFDPLR